MEIILASQSPRRRELLERMGLRNFRVLSPGADETPEPGLTPGELVMSLSARKARAIEGAADSLVIAADTVVCLDGAVLGKPRSAPDAERMLRALSGNVHQVYTGLTVLCRGEQVTEFEETAVRFRPLLPEEISAYVATGEPLDKAGAYGIQGLGSLFVEGIEGDYYNVVGLPVCRLGCILRHFGVNCPAR